jgi:hypothetical protein
VHAAAPRSCRIAEMCLVDGIGAVAVLGNRFISCLQAGRPVALRAERVPLCFCCASPAAGSDLAGRERRLVGVARTKRDLDDLVQTTMDG